MTTSHSSENAWRRIVRFAAAALALTVILIMNDSAAASVSPPWVWPGGVAQVVRAYEQPPTPYEAGHRGIDVAVATGEIVAPADGVVAFRGVVVDRPLITIDHGGGLVSTLEPVESELSPGEVVGRGQMVGTISRGGHTVKGALHLGARLDGDYINPLALLGAAERPVLLPCCG